MEKRLLWTKWCDPVAALVRVHEDEDDDEYVAGRDSFLGDEDVEHVRLRPGFGQMNLGPVAAGPQGLIPLHEGNLPSRAFNFWMGHTNFDITPTVRQLISDTAGVETLEVFTRYRFRVGLGKLFSGDAVRDAIEERLLRGGGSGLDAMKKMLRGKFPFWTIYTLPGGKVDFVGGASREEVNKKGEALAAQAVKSESSW